MEKFYQYKHLNLQAIQPNQAKAQKEGNFVGAGDNHSGEDQAQNVNDNNLFPNFDSFVSDVTNQERNHH